MKDYNKEGFKREQKWKGEQILERDLHNYCAAILRSLWTYCSSIPNILKDISGNCIKVIINI